MIRLGMSAVEDCAEAKQKSFPHAPTWHFATLALILTSTLVHWNGKNIFSLIPLHRSAITVFGVLIIVNLGLTLYAIWGFRLAGKNNWPIDDSRESWKPSAKDMGDGIAVGVALLLVSFVLGLWFPGGRKNIAPELARTGFDHIMELVAYFVASICEEIQFRGYFLQELVAFTHNIGLALVFQAVFFVCLHGLGQGVSGYVTRFIYAVAFGLIAVRRNSLWPSITAHLLINTTAFAVGLF